MFICDPCLYATRVFCPTFSLYHNLQLNYLYQLLSKCLTTKVELLWLSRPINRAIFPILKLLVHRTTRRIRLHETVLMVLSPDAISNLETRNPLIWRSQHLYNRYCLWSKEVCHFELSRYAKWLIYCFKNALELAKKTRLLLANTRSGTSYAATLLSTQNILVNMTISVLSTKTLLLFELGFS